MSCARHLVLACLVQKYLLTSTKVQILTQRNYPRGQGAPLAAARRDSRKGRRAQGACLLVQKYLLTSTKVQILTSRSLGLPQVQ